MSDRALVAAEKEVNSLRERMKRLREESKGAVKETVNTGATMGAAFALSYYESRYPDKSTVLGMPVSLLVGSVATVAGAMGWVGGESDIVGSIGKGALAAYAAKRGAEIGTEHKDAA